VDKLTAERIGRNDATFREANERIRSSAEEYEIVMQVPFICECADERCREIVHMDLSEYEEVRAEPTHFLNVPGHEVAAQGAARVVARRQGYLVVEKIGHAAEVAADLAGETILE
jgi:hypothetical protein